jgi:aromatic-L-amino-acid decarboxylase
MSGMTGGPSPLAGELSQLPELLELVTRHVSEQLDAMPGLPVSPPPDLPPHEVRAWLERAYDFEAPHAAAGVLADVVEHLQRWTVHTTHPAYFGLFNPTPTASGIAGELLAAAMNPQLAAWSHAPAAVESEQHVLRFMAGRLGLATGATAGNITTGGAEANLTAVILALAQQFPDHAEDGVRGLAGQPVFYASRESHLAWLKIAQLTGLGRGSLSLIDIDPDLRLDPGALRAQIAADRAAGRWPFMIVATAGTTGAGIIDPLAELAVTAAQEGLWFHVDAAWAGALALSDRLRPLLAGIERADSVTVDAHKWLSVPMGAGMILTPHGELLRRSFAVSTSYMPDEVGHADDPYTTSVQWSRRFAGLKVFLSLALIGREGYAAQLERDVELGRRLAAVVGERGWQVINDTPLPVVCFLRADRDAGWHQEIAARVVASGSAWVSTVQIAKATAIRACITSYRTQPSDLDTLAGALDTARHAADSGR